MSTLSNTKVINMASPKALASIMENMKPASIKIAITESDSNAMIDKLAAAVKFKAPDGDQDNSFDEGKADDKIELDSNGNYVGKGNMTIFNKEVDLKDPTKTTEQWMETPTGKVSDAKTEEVPTMQGEKEATINENRGIEEGFIGNIKDKVLSKLIKPATQPTAQENIKSATNDLQSGLNKTKEHIKNMQNHNKNLEAAINKNSNISINENEMMDFSDANSHATIGETKSDDLDPKHKAPTLDKERANSPHEKNLNKNNVQSTLKGLLARTPTNGGL